MAKNVKQIFDTNPSTVLVDTDLIYLGKSPYDGTSDSAILVSSILPASTVDNTIPRYNGTSGKVLQSSSVTLSDMGVADGLTGISVATTQTWQFSATESITLFPIQSALGSASAPAYSFNGDTNTGMYSSGAETLNWSTAGTLRLTLSTTLLTVASGISVGIGVILTSAFKLANTNTNIVFDGAGGSSNAFVWDGGAIGFSTIISNSSGVNAASALGLSTINTTANTYLLNAQANGTTAFFMRSDGAQYIQTSLGIGISPVNELDVSGASAFGAYAGVAAPANGVIISGVTAIGTSSPISGAQFHTLSALAYNTYLSGTQTAVDGSSYQVGHYLTPTLNPTSGATATIAQYTLPTFNVPAGQTVTLAAGHVISTTYTGGAGSAVTTGYGLLIGAPSVATVVVTNLYGIFASAPTNASTVNCAAYIENLATGSYSAVTPPSGGIIVSGKSGFGTSGPDASALVDLVSTTLGLGIMVMTTTQKNAISSPREGLLVYDTTLHKLAVRAAAAWETVTSV